VRERGRVSELLTDCIERGKERVCVGRESEGEKYKESGVEEKREWGERE
jgi:hypothetical protein